MEEHLSGTEFEAELAKAMVKIVPAHLKACMENKVLDYDSYGTDNEKTLKLILKYFANIRSVLRDIDLSLNFLGKKRDVILSDYFFLESQGEYYKYHYENYYIRLSTLLDLIGKLGTLLYDLDLDLNKVSAYIFKDKAKKEGHENVSNIVDRLVEKFVELKTERHKKLHSGKADIEPFNEVVIWEDINSIIGSDTDEIQKHYTDEKINEEIQLLKTNTTEIIDIVKEFLEEAKSKLREKITTANNV